MEPKIADSFDLEAAPRFVLENGFKHAHLEVVGSTNKLLLEAAENADNDKLWLTADIQEHGKGRSGRGWTSPRGNLYASVLLKDPAPAELVSSLSLVAALSVHDALSSVCDGDVKIKWPNDMLLAGNKISGLLLEARQLKDGTMAAVVGFGVNCSSHPTKSEEMIFPPTSLAASGYDVAVDVLFAALQKALAGRLAQWNKGEGLAHIVQEWRERVYGIGTQVKVRLPKQTLEGVFEGIDDNGCLILNTEQGVHNISAADVFFE